jgi:hypothetical protein
VQRRQGVLRQAAQFCQELFSSLQCRLVVGGLHDCKCLEAAGDVGCFEKRVLHTRAHAQKIAALKRYTEPALQSSSITSAPHLFLHGLRDPVIVAFSKILGRSALQLPLQPPLLPLMELLLLLLLLLLAGCGLASKHMMMRGPSIERQQPAGRRCMQRRLNKMANDWNAVQDCPIEPRPAQAAVMHARLA